MASASIGGRGHTAGAGSRRVLIRPETARSPSQSEPAKPRYHATEDGRWDYRVTLTFRDAAAAHDPQYEDEVKRKLYPDQDLLGKEESRRFEVLDSHWDVIVDPVDPDAK